MSWYKVRRIVYVAFFWTSIDVIIKLVTENFNDGFSLRSLLVREALVLLMSIILSYLFIYAFPEKFRNKSMLINFLVKTVIILFSAMFMNLMVHVLEDMIAYGMALPDAFRAFFIESMDEQWLLKKTFYWISLLLFTQLFLEIHDKYSPGVFWDILRGKYTQPCIEKKIVMFMDLKDSTPIAELLGHQKYFKFIRDFIHYVSLAIIKKRGTIYQYVGDEIVVSWDASEKNTRRAMESILIARRNLQRHNVMFRRDYGIVPEFRVGIHVGEVTIGEIGVIKKDLAMSGDTMNTTARIRSACNELNQKFIVSEEFMQYSALKDFQVKDLGNVELKGKASGLHLFSLQI